MQALASQHIYKLTLFLKGSKQVGLVLCECARLRLSPADAMCDQAKEERLVERKREKQSRKKSL
jgi:hypothetical protein